LFFLCVLVTLDGCTAIQSWVRSSPKTTPSEIDPDYWEEISFDYKDFNHVIELINQHYIDPKHDRNMAYVYAAHFSLLSTDPPRELITEKFYKQNKDLPDERNRLAGKVIKLDPEHNFYIHFFDPAAKDSEKDKYDKKKLDDKEILAEINKEKDRQSRWVNSWSEIDFNKKGFERIIQYVQKDQKDTKDFDIKKIYLAATQGYLRSLDPHSMLISAKEWEESTKRIQDSSFEGIGALLRPDGDYTMVETPLDENQPSFKAGIRPGDLIIKVDEKSIKGMKIHKVVELIKGPKGTQVTLTLRRKGVPKDFDIKIERAFVKIKNVQSKLMPELPSVGYVKVTGFVDTTLKDLLTHTQKLIRSAPDNRLKGLILDLRNNAGGKLDQAIQMSDVFLSQKSPIVSVKYASGVRKNANEAYLAQLPALVNIPVVVLINARSASASEIVASAIQDNHRGFVVGERSYGKGSVQNLIPNQKFKPSFYVKLTIGRFYGPDGNTIQVTGITPDFPIQEDPKKDFVFHFREENMEGHLTKIPAHPVPRDEKLIKNTESCIAQTGSAEKTIKGNPNPSIRHDYQLLTALDMMRCQLEGTIKIAQNHSKPDRQPNKAN
jgi:C-terminal peptidase prc